jgi:hypothetical protein
MSIYARLAMIGVALWAVGTLALRAVGHWLLPPHPIATVAAFTATIVLAGGIVRRVCRALRLPPGEWPAGAMSLMLPTLTLDAFTAAFFPHAFPNMPASAAGLFGGWMLAWCAGASFGAGLEAWKRR